MRIAIVGAGAWGTALACHVARAHDVMLWTREREHAEALRRERENVRYLPGVRLPPQIVPSSGGLDEVAAFAADDGLLVVATPVAGLRPTLGALAASGVRLDAGVAWVCKGIESATHRFPHQVLAEVVPGVNGAALSGPSFAQEVAAGLPVALVAASPDPALRARLRAGFHHGAARVYASDDLAGVEIGGALKNVMAIAAGICDGLALGHNARAALITRGLAEIARLSRAIGGRPETVMGLAGLGDLVLTCTGDLSRNRRVGLGLAAGRPLAEVVARLGHVAEGVPCAAAAAALAARAGVDMPITAAVCAVLDGSLAAKAAAGSLLAREPRDESDQATWRTGPSA